MRLYEQLQRREAEGRSIRVGIVGCGQMGSGMVHVLHRMVGMAPVALSDVDPSRPVGVLRAIGIPDSRLCVTNNQGQADPAT